MKENTLSMRRALRSVLFVLLLGVAGMTKGYAYDFSAVCSTGQTLYYNIIDADNHYVELTYPNTNFPPFYDEDEGWDGAWNGFTKPEGDIMLPSSVNYNGINYIVTSINESAFYGCSELTGNLSIPDSVTSIGHHAFYGCNGLTGTLTIPNSVTNIACLAFSGCGFTGALTIPNSLTMIGDGAFSYCSGFTSLFLPSSVTYIGIANTWTTDGCDANAFDGCSGLEQIIVDEDNPYFDSRNNCNAIIQTSNNELMIGCKNTVIPNTVTSIGIAAFFNCTCLTSIEIPNSVTFIDSDAFINCTGLTSISILSETPPVNRGAFDEGVNLSIPVYVPCGSVETYQNVYYWSKFTNIIGLCSGEIAVMVNPSESGAVTGAGYYNGGDICELTAMPNPGYSFGNWTENGVVVSTDTVYSFPAHPTTIVANFASENPIVFADANVKALCVANWDTNGDGELSYAEAAAVTDLGEVFYASSITSFNELQYFIGLVSINYDAFSSCEGLTSVVIPNSVTSIGYNAFSGCTGLTTVDIPNSVTSIGFYAFSGCEGLTSVVIPNSVTSIDGYAFENCTGLTSVVIPNSVTSIGLRAFNNCNSLEQIVVEAGNTVYDSRENSNAIIKTSTNELVLGCKNTVIPNSVTSIGGYAFYGCSGLTSVVIPNSVTEIRGCAFSGCTGLTSVVIPNSVTSIGYNAFSGCTGLTTVDIPNSVTSIGSSAFSYCTGLTSMTIMAENPPTLGWSVFSNVNLSIPVYVPCGSLEAYSSISWGGFTNFIEICGNTITVSANPEEGGTVEGGGTYDENTICTVTATANEGYEFVSWTENGEVVSTDATYRLPVTGDRNLTANFDLYYHWTPVDEGLYSESMVLIGVVLIDGVEQYSDQLEIGIFSGEECRATCRPEELFITGHYLAWTNVYGENGDELTFRLYDHSSGMELALTPPSSVVFTEDGYGTPIEPYELNFYSSVMVSASVSPMDAGTVEGAGEYVFGTSCTLVATANEGYMFVNWTENDEVVSSEASYSFEVTGDRSLVAHFIRVQTSPLISGWNWYSSYIEQEGINGLEMLENSLGSSGLRIQGKNASTDYFVYENTGYWYGTLSALDNTQTYKIRTSEACEAVIVGEETLPANHPVTIVEGWNWIGYPSSQSTSIEVALGGFTPEPNDVIKSRNQSSTYISYGGYNLWYGQLNTLEPGQGYMYKSNTSEPKTLVFQTGRGEEGLKPNITPQSNLYVPEGENYADNMLITAVVEMGGEELRSEDYELAAFVGNECRGSVKLMYVEPFDRYVAFLLAFGDKTEDLHFVLTDGTGTSLSDDLVRYETDGTVGTLTEPVTLHFGTLGVSDDQMTPVHIYPNPSKGVFNVEGIGIKKVEVVDAYGQVIFSEEVENEHLQINLSDKSAGAYLLRVITANGVTIKKLVKE